MKRIAHKFNSTSLLNSICHWINFERLNKRSSLFSEKYLCNPIGQFLKSRYSSGVRIEEPFGFLLKGKRDGRLDYCVLKNKKPIIAIETKWIRNKNTTSNQRILRDILKLALMKQKYNDCFCLFILLGKENVIAEFIKKLNDRASTNGSCVLPDNGTLKLEKKLLEQNDIFNIALSEINANELPRSFSITHKASTAKTESKTAIVVNSWVINIHK